jgi:hypothetical protein
LPKKVVFRHGCYKIGENFFLVFRNIYHNFCCLVDYLQCRFSRLLILAASAHHSGCLFIFATLLHCSDEKLVINVARIAINEIVFLQILRLMKGYDEFNTILLPPRHPAEKLPQELLDYYDGL